jgi:hypothetical protein
MTRSIPGTTARSILCVLFFAALAGCGGSSSARPDGAVLTGGDVYDEPLGSDLDGTAPENDATSAASDAGLPEHDSAVGPDADFVPKPGCKYMGWGYLIGNCNGAYDTFVLVKGLSGNCPDYYVFSSNSRSYADVDTLLADNGCDPTCVWELFSTSDGTHCGYGFSVDSYVAIDPACPVPGLVWPSTGGIFSSYEEMEASLPECPDGGANAP